MTFKTFALGLVSLVTLSLITPVYADIILHSDSFANEDLCSHIGGDWNGTGKVSLGSKTCNYKGSGRIDSKPSSDEFNMNITLDSVSGSCLVKHKDLTMSGSCKNNTIIIKDTHTDLKGDLSDNGNKANVHGDIKYSVFTLNAVIDLHK